MPSLLSIIELVRSKQADEDCWLYVAGSIRKLSLQTEAELALCEIDESSHQEIVPADFRERGLASTIDVQTVESCIEWADQLTGSSDNGAALDVIRYYILFDAYPETLGAPDPLSREKIVQRLDREFCHKLGPEDPRKPCRREGCSRGAVRLSLFCRRHHFENVQKRPYPFDD